MLSNAVVIQSPVPQTVISNSKSVEFEDSSYQIEATSTQGNYMVLFNKL